MATEEANRKLIDFVPERDEGKQLYEIRSQRRGDAVLTVTVPTDTPFEQAAQTPWYYLVEA
jgi:hypothetical protein